MPTEVTDVGPCKRRISVSIPADQVKKAFADAWRDARQNVSIKGFRPGKVPRSILEKRYGSYIHKEVREHLINNSYREALTQHSLRPVAMPQLDAEKLELAPDKPFEFQLDIEIRPEFALPAYRGLKVGAPPVVVQDAAIDREVDRLRASKATIETLPDGSTATKGDYLTADVTYQVDGASVVQREGAIVDTRRDEVDGVAVQSGTAAFVGKGIGATVAVPCRLPAEFEPAGFANAEALLMCTIKEIKRIQMPEMTDELAQGFGAQSAADLRARVTEEYQNHLARQRNTYIEDRLFDELIKTSEFDLPQDLLERATNESMAQLETQLVQSGVEAAEAKANATSHLERIRQDQARALRVNFLVDRIAEAEKTHVSDNELEQALYTLAAIHKRDVQEVYNEVVNSGRLHSLRTQILESKVRKLLREAADIAEVNQESSGS